MRTRYYPHERLLKANSLKISDLPIEIQDQIKVWRMSKEKGYHTKYVPQSEKISRAIENFIEKDIDNLYNDIEKVAIPNHLHTVGFTPQRETKGSPEPKETVKKGIENVTIPYHSNTIGFSTKKQTGESVTSQNEVEKDIETDKILNSFDTKAILAENEPQKATDTEKDIEKNSIPNHSEINSDFEENEPNELELLEKDIENVSIPNVSEKKGVLVKIEESTLPQKVTVLCPTFCKKIGKIQTACYSIMKFAEQENIEPILNFEDLPSFGIKTGFWSNFPKLNGYKGKFFEIRRVHNEYAYCYEVIAIQPLPSEAFTEIEESQLLSDGAKEEKSKEFDLSDLKSVNELIQNRVVEGINESKFYDTLNDVEKAFYDIIHKANKLAEKPLKHVNTTLSELKEKGIRKLKKNDLISEYFKVTPLKEKGAFRITYK
ncbi:hypothetical protein ACE193_01375 [Bernardetia sp. OM2101]|uniref:hypothetical protein n=1 Tax=Bernardetia sp. OM2101 TaxID=3344876 RepID=UPI0035CEDD94